jgi:hypothetical protein
MLFDRQLQILVAEKQFVHYNIYKGIIGIPIKKILLLPALELYINRYRNLLGFHGNFVIT